MPWREWGADWSTEGNWKDYNNHWSRHGLDTGWNSRSWGSNRGYEMSDADNIDERTDEDLSAIAQFLGSTSTANGHKKGILKQEKQGKMGCRAGSWGSICISRLYYDYGTAQAMEDVWTF